MDFEYYNPSEDKQSCVVRTMTKLSGKNYSEVKMELIDLAEKLGFDTYNTPDVFEVFMKKYGINKIEDFTDLKLRNLNLEKGTFCLFCTNRQGFNHLIPVIDNVIYDRRNDSLDLYVIRVYQEITIDLNIGALRGVPAEGVASNEVRARGRLSPTKTNYHGHKMINHLI